MAMRFKFNHFGGFRHSLAVSISVIYLLLATGALAQMQAPIYTKPAAETFKIAGTVVNAVTGAPLAQVRVAIADTRNRTKAMQQWSSENGHFEFSGLPAGKFSLQGAKRGYLSSAYDEHERFSTAIVTGPEFRTEELVLRLTPMAVITGHITDEAGEPMRKAHVVLFREDHQGGWTRINRVGSSGTDDQGFYDFALLAPGTYFVSVTGKPWYAVHPFSLSESPARPASPPNTELDVAYPTTYYGGVTEAESASPITLSGGDRLQIDVRLSPVPALHLIVRVPTDPPNRNPGLRLQKQVFDNLEFVAPEGIHYIAPGVQEITGVPAGRYTVRMGGTDSGQTEQSVNLELNHDGQDLSNTRGEPLSSITLTPKLPGEEKLPKQLFLGLQNAKRRFIAVGVVDASGETKLDGVPPGKYALLAASREKQLYVVQTSTSAGQAAGHDLDVPPGTHLEVTATLMAGVADVEGAVQKGGKPVAGVMVVLVPENPETHFELFRRDQSDWDGTFKLPGVVPGTYTIVAVESGWGFEWLQPNVLARYVQHGQNVIIGTLISGSVHLPDPVEVQPR